MRKPRAFNVTGKAVVLILIAFFLFFAATNIRSGWLYMVDAVLASLLLYSGGIVWRASDGLRISRRLLQIAQQGEDVPITLRVENTDRWSFLCFKISDVFPPRGLSPEETEAVLCERFFLRLPGGQSRDFTYYLPARRRGRHLFSAYRVTLYGPLGLFSRTRTYPLESELLVYPQLPDLAGFSTSGADLRQHRNGDIPQPFLIGRTGMLPKGIRDYRPGDSPRLIHWRSSARLARLMVKDMEVETGLAFNVFLDTTRPAAEDDERFETALKAIGAIAKYGLKHGHVCQILTPRREGVVSAPRLLDFLARLEADCDEPLAARLADLADTLGPRASSILVLQRLDGQVITACAGLRARGVDFSLFVAGPITPAARQLAEQAGLFPEDAASLWQQPASLLTGSARQDQVRP